MQIGADGTKIGVRYQVASPMLGGQQMTSSTFLCVHSLYLRTAVASDDAQSPSEFFATPFLDVSIGAPLGHLWKNGLGASDRFLPQC